MFSRLLGYFALICGLSGLINRLHDRVWKAQLAISEHPMIAIAAGTIAGRGGSRFGWLGALLSATSLINWLRARRDMDAMMREAFGEDYESRIPSAANVARMRLYNHALFTASADVQVDIPFHETPHRTLKLDLYKPLNPPEGPLPAIIAIHGGGWHNGDKGNWFAPHHRYLAACGYAVFDVQYRFTTTDSAFWPDQLSDIRAAIRHVKGCAGVYSIDPDRIALMGRSAGGQLAMQAAYRATGDYEDTRVRSVISVYAPGNLFLTAQAHDFRVVKLLGGTSYERPEEYHDASPITFIDDNAPPTLLLHGYKDSLVTPLHSEMILNRMRQHGRPAAHLRVPWARHGFDAVPFGMGAHLVQYYEDRFLALTLLTETHHE